jgi:hypothetical protein
MSRWRSSCGVWPDESNRNGGANAIIGQHLPNHMTIGVNARFGSAKRTWASPLAMSALSPAPDVKQCDPQARARLTRALKPD